MALSDSSAPDENQHPELDQEVERTRTYVENPEQKLDVQQLIAYAGGMFLEDVTLRTLVESLAEGLIVIESHGTIVVANGRAAEMFGYEPEQIIGRPLSILIPDRFVKRHAQQIYAYFDEPHIRPMGIGMDLIGKRSDDSEFPIEISLSHLDTAAGSLGLAFISDISVRKQMERELQMRSNELESFAYTLAHDLKGSLTVLVGFSEELAESHRTMPDDVQHKYLTLMARYGMKMNSIIDSLLLFARLRQQSTALAPIEDVHALIEAVLDRLQILIEERQADISVPDTFEPATGNAEWVEEVWLNYISNAIKYGGPEPHVEIGSRLLDNGHVEYWVKDRGPGLTAEEQTALFTEFSRLDEIQVDGTGLGLSIVKRIIDRLDGEVGVRSEKGGGSTFFFTLPVVDA